MLFADDQVLIARTEDDLQRALYTLNETAADYNLIISNTKSKVLAFIGDDHIRAKIIINDKTLEQISNFNYLGYNISYTNNNSDIKTKLSKFQYLCGTIRRTLKGTRRDTLLKFYKVMAMPTLLYGCENWTTTRQQERNIETAEMKFLRFVAGYTLRDHKRSEDIRQELGISDLNTIIKDYRKKWYQHVTRMEDTRITKKIMEYVPRGKRNVGRPKKRWKDQL